MVNNAAVAVGKGVDEIEMKDVRAVMDTNFTSYV